MYPCCYRKDEQCIGRIFRNRIGEIHYNQSFIEQYCQVGNEGEWWHVESKFNGADRPTRLDSTIDDISPGSEWQNGPSYLYLPREEWPLERDFVTRKTDCIPSNEILKKYRAIANKVVVQVVHDGIQTLINKTKFLDPYYTNDWDKLVRRTQVYLQPLFSMDQGIWFY
jgi:hypothetical protein